MGDKYDTQRSRVYVLGAGFSKPAGYPLQNEILSRVKTFISKRTLVGSPQYIDALFAQEEEELRNFLSRVFPGIAEPSLEDLFTLLDQSIDASIGCKGFTSLKLQEVRKALATVILFVIHDAATSIESLTAELYRSFAAHLIQRKISDSNQPDRIISINWDTLLEDSIYFWVEKALAKQKVDVDYCCDTSPLVEGSGHVPSLQHEARGIKSIKVLKLHGSANWLICPGCGRLFTGLGSRDSVWELYGGKKKCRCCVDWDKDGKPQLEPFFISPTFVKRFSNPHIQMTWHNAYLELAKASEVVFIGYSLPEADYHVRTLLARSIDPTAKISCVTKGNAITVKRYCAFFGKKRVNVVKDGVEAYFGSLLESHTLKAWESRLRRAIKNS